MIPSGCRSIVLGGSLMVSLIAGMAVALAGPAWASESFGVEGFASSIVSDETGAGGGVADLQAGSHPYALTTAVVFNHVVTGQTGQAPRVRTYGDPKDIEINLPRGVIIDPRATTARCTESELESRGSASGCPDAAAVGVFSIRLDGTEVLDEPVYNMAPPAGVPAELGFDAAGVGLIMHVGGRVRTGGDYGLSADISGIPDEHPIYGLDLTLWGDPSNASHDDERGACADEEAKQLFKATGIRDGCPVELVSEPFLTLPSSCTGEPPAATMSTDSWQEPGSLTPDGTPDLSDPPWVTASASWAPMAGCQSLDFSPRLTVGTAEPESASAESPSGLSIDLRLPGEESARGVAAAGLEEATVRLPDGIAISPSAAGGREACTPAEIGLHTALAPSCPDAAKVGAAKIVTPLSEGPLEGAIYLAQPYDNEPAFSSSPEHPGGSLLALYLVAEGDGMLIKLAGRVEADPDTGRLTIAWSDIPQLPFDELRLNLFGGPRAILVTPPGCGAYPVSTSLMPWSGEPASTQTSTLEIDSGPNGGACPSGAFNPSFTAGTADNRAGASSSFSVTLARREGEQRFAAFTLKLPPGLMGSMKDVAPCPEPQASSGQCSQASEIGTTTVGVGPGADPFYLPEPGRPTNKVYLTGPYGAAPFGLSIVVPAIAGPFDLGDIVIRATVAIDPRTAQLTIASVPGAGGIPTIEEGIPLDIRTLNVTIDRPGFVFNPTSCAPRTVAGAISSTGGSSVAVSSPFQAVSCPDLPFKPELSALTHARASKANGAYLHVKVASGPGQANIAKVKVDLPRQLSLRFATLQKACPARVFEADPAACPGASVVGTGTVNTPLLGHSLSGPAYLVSHGVVASPALVLVLQGAGVTLELEGQASIRKGIASSAFRSLPDVPIGTLDLVFGTGPHSAFAVNPQATRKRGLCSQTLNMPTAIVGQNGAQINRTTRIGITGCSPAPSGRRRAKQSRHRHRSGHTRRSGRPR